MREEKQCRTVMNAKKCKCIKKSRAMYMCNEIICGWIVIKRNGKQYMRKQGGLHPYVGTRDHVLLS